MIFKPLPACSPAFLLPSSYTPPRVLGKVWRLASASLPTHLAVGTKVRAGEVLGGHGLSLSLLQGLELCRVVAVHVENLLSAREKRLTLPPSEITLL